MGTTGIEHTCRRHSAGGGAEVLVKEKAAKDAAEVLSAYWGSRVPVLPETLARDLGMSIAYVHLREGISGMLQVEPGIDPVIYIDQRESEQRQRFTIAHELGHFFERKNRGETDYNFIDRRGGRYDAHELYADEFAANLLMPEAAIRQFRTQGLGTLQMARKFGVSPMAMQIRLRRLGIL